MGTTYLNFKETFKTICSVTSTVIEVLPWGLVGADLDLQLLCQGQLENVVMLPLSIRYSSRCKLKIRCLVS